MPYYQIFKTIPLNNHSNIISYGFIIYGPHEILTSKQTLNTNWDFNNNCIINFTNHIYILIKFNTMINNPKTHLL